jgi:hypothetical protein
MNYQTDMGISLLDTYCYVHKIGGGKELLYIQVNWYVDWDARNNNLKPIGSKGYSFIPDVGENSVNFIKQAYLYLKTLDEFSDSIDI